MYNGDYGYISLKFIPSKVLHIVHDKALHKLWSYKLYPTLKSIIHDRTSYCHPVSQTWMHGSLSQLNVALIRKLSRSLVCMALFFDILSTGVCTTMHWQTSGRLVQELHVCTAASDWITFGMTDWEIGV